MFSILIYSNRVVGRVLFRVQLGVAHSDKWLLHTALCGMTCTCTYYYNPIRIFFLNDSITTYSYMLLQCVTCLARYPQNCMRICSEQFISMTSLCIQLSGPFLNIEILNISVPISLFLSAHLCLYSTAVLCNKCLIPIS